jgi:DNA-binding transcriptional ArsR family regulator
LSPGKITEGVSKPTMSAHFAVLKEADMVQAENSGKSAMNSMKNS